MNRRHHLPLLFALLFHFGFSTVGADESRSYNLILPDGTPIPTTIRWKNINGLDSLRGDFHYAAGDLGFTGRNSASGFIWMNDSNGTYYEFRKEVVGKGFRWVGKNGRGERMVLLPLGGNVPAPAPPSGSGETVRQYTMTGPYGEKFPATLIWSNIKGLGPIKGSLFSSGENLTINGQNSRSGFIYFNDQNGTYYELTKQAPVRGKVRWTGSARFNDGTMRSIELNEN